MSHKRTLIRNALVALLKGTGPSYATAAGLRVYSNRTTNVTTLPAILVYDSNETASPRDMRTSGYIRKLNMNIKLLVKGTSGIDATLDDFALVVENLMNANRTLSGTASGIIYQGTELTFDSSGEETVGEATLTYEISYLT